MSSDSQSTPEKEDKITSDSEKPVCPSSNTQLGETVPKEKASEQESSQVENIQEERSEDVVEDSDESLPPKNTESAKSSNTEELGKSIEKEAPVLSDDQVKLSQTIVEDSDKPEPSKNDSEESEKSTEETSLLSDEKSQYGGEDQSFSKDQSSTDQSYFSAGEDLQDSATESQLNSSDQSHDSQTESHIAECNESQLSTIKESTTSKDSDLHAGDQPQQITKSTSNTSFSSREEDGQMHADTLSIPAGQKRIDQFFKPAKKTQDNKAKQDQTQQTKLTEEDSDMKKEDVPSGAIAELQENTTDKTEDAGADGVSPKDDKANEDNKVTKASADETEEDKAENLAENIVPSDVFMNHDEAENAEEKDESSDDEITFKGKEPEFQDEDDRMIKAIEKDELNKPIDDQKQNNVESSDSPTLQTDTDVGNNLTSIQEETDENTKEITDKQEDSTELIIQDAEEMKPDTKDAENNTESKDDDLGSSLAKQSTTKQEEQIDDYQQHDTSLIRQSSTEGSGSSENAESDSDDLLWDSDSFYGEQFRA